MPLWGRFYNTGVETVRILRPSWGGGRPGVPAESRGPAARVGSGERGPGPRRAGLGKKPQGLRGPGAGAPSSLRCPLGLEVGSVATGLAAERTGGRSRPEGEGRSWGLPGWCRGPAVPRPEPLAGLSRGPRSAPLTERPEAGRPHTVSLIGGFFPPVQRLQWASAARRVQRGLSSQASTARPRPGRGRWQAAGAGRGYPARRPGPRRAPARPPLPFRRRAVGPRPVSRLLCCSRPFFPGLAGLALGSAGLGGRREEEEGGRERAGRRAEGGGEERAEPVRRGPGARTRGETEQRLPAGPAPRRRSRRRVSRNPRPGVRGAARRGGEARGAEKLGELRGPRGRGSADRAWRGRERAVERSEARAHTLGRPALGAAAGSGASAPRAHGGGGPGGGRAGAPRGSGRAPSAA